MESRGLDRAKKKTLFILTIFGGIFGTSNLLLFLFEYSSYCGGCLVDCGQRATKEKWAEKYQWLGSEGPLLIWMGWHMVIAGHKSGKGVKYTGLM